MASKYTIPAYKTRGTQVTCEPEVRNAGGQISSRNEDFRSNEQNALHPAVARILTFREQSQRELYPLRSFGGIGYGANDKFANDGGGIPGTSVPAPQNVIGHPGAPAPRPKR